MGVIKGRVKGEGLLWGRKIQFLVSKESTIWHVSNTESLNKVRLDYGVNVRVERVWNVQTHHFLVKFILNEDIDAIYIFLLFEIGSLLLGGSWFMGCWNNNNSIAT